MDPAASYGYIDLIRVLSTNGGGIDHLPICDLSKMEVCRLATHLGDPTESRRTHRSRFPETDPTDAFIPSGEYRGFC